jgi:hypothetical protein
VECKGNVRGMEEWKGNVRGMERECKGNGSEERREEERDRRNVGQMR